MNQTSLDGSRSETEIQPISPELETNLQWLEKHFEHCEDLTFFQWRFGLELRYTAYSVYFESLFEDKTVNYMKASLQDLVPHEVGPALSVTPEDVGIFHREGLGTAKDVGAAIAYFQEAWERGYPQAHIELASIYVNEPGFANEALAKKHAVKARQAGLDLPDGLAGLL